MNQSASNQLSANNVSQRRLLYLVIAAFSLETIIRFAIIVLRKLPLISIFADWVTPCLFIALILLNYQSTISKKIRQHDILFVLVFYLVVGFSYLIYPNTRPYVQEQSSTVFLVFPAYYFLGIIIDPNKKTADMLALLAKAIIVVDILFVAYYLGVGNELGEDAMARAYRMLPSVLFLTAQAFNRHKWYDWLWMVFATLYIFTCGTRGPIIVVFVYLLYCLLIKKRLTVKGRLLSLGSVVAFLIFYYSDAFLSFVERLINVFQKIGVSTRVFDYMLSNTLVSDTSGRDDIFVRIFELLKENPFGYGVLGEYQFLNCNTHNIYLQLMMHFGVIVGGLMILYIFWLLFKSYKCGENAYAKDFIVMWGCITLIRGFAGGSYLSYYFALLLGVCVASIRCKVQEKV